MAQPLRPHRHRNRYAPLYSVVVDSVGEVLGLDPGAVERNPTTLDPVWREVSAGIYRLDKKLLIVLDVARVLDFSHRVEAA
jgi:purine-binding chemotaxis protein CheW